MQFKALAALALASAANAQNQANVDKYFSDVSNYFSSLLMDPNFASAAQGLLTAAPDAVQSLQALQTQTDLNQLASGPPPLITALPSPYNSMFLSVYSAELAIASSDGIISNGKLVGGSSVAGAVSSLVSSVQNSIASGVTSAFSSAAANATRGANGTVASPTSSMGGSSGGSSMGGSSGGSSGGSKTSTAGAPHATAGVLAMGAIAGAIGGLAVLL